MKKVLLLLVVLGMISGVGFSQSALPTGKVQKVTTKVGAQNAQNINKVIQYTNYWEEEIPEMKDSIDANTAALTPVANAQTDELYTFVLTDANKIVTLNNADTVDVTVPPNSSVAFPVGTILDFVQLGEGPVVIGPGSGVTLNMYNSDSIMAGQYAAGSVWQYSVNTWLLFGNF